MENLLGVNGGLVLHSLRTDRHAMKDSRNLTEKVLRQCEARFPGFKLTKKCAVEQALLEWLEVQRDD